MAKYDNRKEHPVSGSIVGQCYHCGQSRMVRFSHKQGVLKIYSCKPCAKKYGPGKRFNNRMEELAYNAACKAIGQVS